jgi:hypothetical protein
MPCEMLAHDIYPALDRAVGSQRFVQLEVGKYTRKNVADA